MATTIVCIKKGRDRANFIQELQSLNWRAVKGLPRHFIIEGVIPADFPLKDHEDVEAIYDGDAEVKHCLQPLTLDAELEDDSWAIARVIRRNPPWNKNHIVHPFETYFRCVRDGTGVDYYTLDTGIRLDHDEFGGRATNVYEFHSSGGLGDDNGHGTATSSIACGSTVGIARGALLFSFKCFNSAGSGSGTAIVTAAGEALDFYNSRNRPAVVNLSFVGGLAESITEDMIDAGMVLVAAAGNTKTDMDTTSVLPAEWPDVIGVGGSAMADTPYYQGEFGTNYGSNIDVVAPAQNIRHAWRTSSSDYKKGNGTSLACPLASGIVACMLQGYRKLTSRAQVQEVVLKLKANASTGQVVNAYGITLPDRMLYVDPDISFETITSLIPSLEQTIEEDLLFDDLMVGASDNQVFEDTLVFIDDVTVLTVIELLTSDTLTFTELAFTSQFAEAEDTLVFTDDSSAVVHKIGILSESLDIIEDLDREMIYNQFKSENIEFIEQLQRNLVRILTLSENITFSEAIQSVLAKITSDSITLSDDLQFFVAKLAKDVMEFGDIASVNVEYGRLCASVLELFDIISVELFLRRDLVDSLSLVDAVSGERVTPASDTLTFSELIEETLSKVTKDTLTFTDLVTTAKVKNVLITDLLNFSDNTSTNLVITQVLAETLTLLETLSYVRERFFEINDTLTFSETLYREIHVVLAPDTFTFSDDLIVNKIGVGLITESIVFADILSVNTVVTQLLTDSLSFYEGPPSELVPNTSASGSYGTIYNKMMTFIGKNVSIALPPPEFNDFYSDRNQVIFKRRMDGAVSTYVKTCPEQKIHYEFILSRPKAAEFRAFLDSEHSNLLVIYDWNGYVWVAKLLSDTIDKEEFGRWEPCGNKTRVTIEFMGHKLGN